MLGIARRGLRLATGLVLGAVLAVAEFPFVVLSGVSLLCVFAWPRGRRVVLKPLAAAARALTETHRRRLRVYVAADTSDAYADHRALQYLSLRWGLGVLGALVLGAALIGVAYGISWIFILLLTDVRHPGNLALSSIGGLFLLFLSLQGTFGVAGLETRLARYYLGPSHHETLERRIEELAATRAGVIFAVNDERRRIERDLHDGVQQRLVALGMLLGRALRSQDARRAEQLLRQAHEESGQALTELREVAWRVYPTVLDEAGLRAALETVAERSAIPVCLDYALATEPDTAVATVAYFVVSEAVTNAVKHSGAGRITVRVAPGEGAVLVHIEDDGPGGADSSGSGLFGLARRVAAVDGRFRVDSPAGGPTTITAELPCA
ncbi:sensor histidine kinase [Streptomyces sp. RPA4-5]|uniref:sensor histidine kinase n=1 Tax=unclassified Streptomyces TaxID=2593676 RepID=UPI00143EB590|nr:MULTISPECIES: histidine kinase [unclassified Streptomyces]QIY55332.1 sensor histidine kinase [Streptomyces sp. RPA4-5]WJY38047.1 histidine kinase [Streptomyces sp. P9-2B-2]